MASTIESLFAKDPIFGAPRVDLDRLAASRPIHEMPGFMPDW